MTAPSLVIDKSTWHSLTGTVDREGMSINFGFSEVEAGQKRARESTSIQRVTMAGYASIQMLTHGQMSCLFRTLKQETHLSAVSSITLSLCVQNVDREAEWYSSGTVSGESACVGMRAGIFTLNIGNSPYKQYASEAVFDPTLLEDECFIRHIVHCANVMFDSLVAFEQQLSPSVQCDQIKRSPVYTCRLPGRSGWAYLKRHSKDLYPDGRYCVMDISTKEMSEVTVPMHVCDYE